MPLTCSRCGSLNPDGNSFCQVCGAPLAVVAHAAPAGPPPGIMGPPPDLPPPSYESPYYTPAAGTAQPPVHRMPWLMIVGAVVGLVLVMGACGTAFALLNNRKANQGQTGSEPCGRVPGHKDLPKYQDNEWFGRRCLGHLVAGLPHSRAGWPKLRGRDDRICGDELRRRRRLFHTGVHAGLEDEHLLQ